MIFLFGIFFMIDVIDNVIKSLILTVIFGFLFVFLLRVQNVKLNDFKNKVLIVTITVFFITNFLMRYIGLY